MEISKEYFEKIITSATRSDCNVFDKMGNYLILSERNLISNLIGDIDINSLTNDIQEEFKRCICLSAFKEAIPDLDLILTPTGFGVVSNSNLAPASKDRVLALAEAVDAQAMDSYERIISLLLGKKEWYDKIGKYIITSVFYKSSFLSNFSGLSNPHYGDLVKSRPKILSIESFIKKKISSELYSSIVEKVAMIEHNTFYDILIDKLRALIGYSISDKSDVKNLSVMIEDIENYVEDNADTFTEYKNSKIYKLKHLEYYENQKSDSTYFFG